MNNSELIRIAKLAKEWMQLRRDYFLDKKNEKLKRELRYAERTLSRLLEFGINWDEALTDDEQKPLSAEEICSTSGKPRWIDVAEAVPEMYMPMEKKTDMVPTVYGTDVVFVANDDLSVISEDYRIMGPHGEMWKSRGSWRKWMPKIWLKRIEV